MHKCGTYSRGDNDPPEIERQGPLNALTVNLNTGYKESSNSDFTFNSKRKTEFLELARQVVEEGHEYPNIGDLCRVMGISVRTFENHLEKDKRFAEDWRELELKGEATCLSDMYALRKKNPMYMFGWLRSRFPEKYDPSRKINIQADFTPLKEILSRENYVIDAEIVENK